MSIKTKKKTRPELILGIILALCGILFAAMTVLCIPYFSPESSPAIESPGHDDPLSLRQTELPPQIPGDSDLPLLQTPPPPLPNPYEKTDFQYDGLFLKNLYTHSRVGIDVSAHQGKIDWQKVKEAGVEFAFIRVGYRGYGQAGKLVADEYGAANMKGAREAGLDVGVYFFSQAITTEEAAQEAEMLLELIKGYDINLPVVYDWETVFAEDARTNSMQARGVTDCALTFCQIIEEAGYTPMVYFNTYQSLNLMHLEELKQYEFWLAWYSDLMRYPYKVRMWQYTDSGRVPGIETNVDLNVYMTE